jgi:hypothetical protein
MANHANSKHKVPVICADPSSVGGAGIFNPNSWSGESRNVVQSCWSEYSVLHYCIGQISGMCTDAEQLCQKQIVTLQEQWQLNTFPLKEMVFFAQQPDLHIRIEAFFSGVKTLLDLLVQLISTEKVVGISIDGFHRDKDQYGGRVLNALRGNGVKVKKELAASLDELISKHKTLWIDQIIQARDLLIHPERGTHQLMFILELSEKSGALICLKAHPPEINSKPIHEYAQETLKQITGFSSNFLTLLGETGNV